MPEENNKPKFVECSICGSKLLETDTWRYSYNGEPVCYECFECISEEEKKENGKTK